jgi:urease accessory protein
MSNAAETVVDRLREALGSHGGASAWNGRMVARVVAQDGFHLRKTLVSAISAIAGVQALPSISAL